MVVRYFFGTEEREKKRKEKDEQKGCDHHQSQMSHLIYNKRTMLLD